MINKNLKIKEKMKQKDYKIKISKQMKKSLL
jgi:hypothetical protein